jgi:hypothetical protein
MSQTHFLQRVLHAAVNTPLAGFPYEASSLYLLHKVFIAHCRWHGPIFEHKSRYSSCAEPMRHVQTLVIDGEQ